MQMANAFMDYTWQPVWGYNPLVQKKGLREVLLTNQQVQRESYVHNLGLP